MIEITREEAREILEEVKTIDDSMYQYNEKYLQALEFAISDMERVEELEAENKRLKEGIANVKAEIEKYKAVDICKVSHVLQIINKHLGE